MTISAPGFYGPQGRVVRQQLAMPHMLEDVESFRYGDRMITNFEMEGSAIAGIATQLGHDATGTAQRIGAVGAGRRSTALTFLSASAKS